jgi:hypothetical protein
VSTTTGEGGIGVPLRMVVSACRSAWLSARVAVTVAVSGAFESMAIDRVCGV